MSLTVVYRDAGVRFGTGYTECVQSEQGFIEVEKRPIHTGRCCGVIGSCWVCARVSGSTSQSSGEIISSLSTKSFEKET